MSLRCSDGGLAEITPWVPIPAGRRGAMEPLEHERDRCQRPECRKVAWQHHATTTAEDLSREILQAVRR